MAEPKLGLWGLEQLGTLPGPPDEDLKRRVLAVYLENPFIDDDVAALCLRLGALRHGMQAALDSLCADGFLAAGARGYALALTTVEAPTEKTTVEAPTEKTVALSVEMALPQSTAVVDADSEALETVSHILDALPYGALLLDDKGAHLAVNARCVEWTGLALVDLDADGVRSLCGADPLQGLGGHSCQVEGRPLVFDSRPFPWQGGQAWLVSLRPTLSEGENNAQMAFQEELFGTFKERLVKPLEYVETFLDEPESGGLGAARAALAQINWFLQDIYLAGGSPSEE